MIYGKLYKYNERIADVVVDAATDADADNVLVASRRLAKRHLLN